MNGCNFSKMVDQKKREAYEHTDKATVEDDNRKRLKQKNVEQRR